MHTWRLYSIIYICNLQNKHESSLRKATGYVPIDIRLCTVGCCKLGLLPVLES